MISKIMKIGCFFKIIANKKIISSLLSHKKIFSGLVMGFDFWKINYFFYKIKIFGLRNKYTLKMIFSNQKVLKNSFI